MKEYRLNNEGLEIQELLNQIKNKTIYGNATRDTAGLMSAEDKDTLATLVDNVGENIQQLNNLNQAVSENTTAIETNTGNIATNTSAISTLNTTTGNLGTRLDAAEETLDNIFQLDANNFMGIYDAAANLPAMTGAGWALVGQDLTALLAYVYNIPQAQWQQYGTTTYDYSDYSGLATQVATIGSKLGDLTQLHTTDKTSLVNALNEVKDNSSTTAEDTTYTDTHGIGAANVQDALDIVVGVSGNLKEIIGAGYYEKYNDIDLSTYTVQDCSLADKKWHMSGTKGRHIAVPVSSAQKYRIALESIGGDTESATGSYYGFVTSSYNPPYTNNASCPYVNGGNRIYTRIQYGFTTVVPPEDAAYLILNVVGGDGSSCEWILQTVEALQPGEKESIDSRLQAVEETAENLDEVVNGTPAEVLKELQWNDYAYQSSNKRIYAYLKDTVQEGDIVTVNCPSIGNYQYDLLIMSTGTWGGSATIIWQTGWVSDSSYSKTIEASEAGNYIRIQYRDANEASIAGQIPTIENLFEVSYKRAYIERINGLVQYVGQPPLDIADQIDLSGYTESPRSLGSTAWYLDTSNPVQSHIAIPVEAEKGYRIQFDSATTASGGFWAFVKNTYTPPTSNSAVPFAEGQSSRNYLPIGEYIDVVAPVDAAYLILTIVDGGGSTSTWSLWNRIPSLKKNLFEAMEELENSNKSLKKFRVLQWNIGHFALGGSSDTRITHDKYEEMRQKWAERINEINADIIMCCEYNTNFVNASGDYAAITARDAIFPPSLYSKAYIGTKPSTSSYMQTAIFSNMALEDVRQVTFPNTTQAGRYYQIGKMDVNGTDVMIVETHLDFNQGTTGEANRALQIQKLISDLSSFDHVILAADFNTSNGASEFDTFLNAGYNMANHGYIGDFKTYPSGETQTSYLDNILCKGFTINGIHIINDAELSDHCGIYADLTMI